jgi:hypothetical protein
MMLKKIGLVAAVAAAGMVLFGGMASATSYPSTGSVGGHHSVGDNGLEGQVGLVNLNNLDMLHNTNVVPGLCDNDVNVLGVQVPVRHVADGLNVPILSPGGNLADGGATSCASGAINDGGTHQAN